MTGTDTEALGTAIEQLADECGALLAVVELCAPYRLQWTSAAFARRAVAVSGSVPECLKVGDRDVASTIASLLDTVPKAISLERHGDDSSLGLVMVSIDSADQRASLLETVLAVLPDAIYAKDRSARFIFKNASDLSLMGASTSLDAMGRTDFDYYPDHIAQRLYDDDMRVIETGEPIIAKTEVLTGKDGVDRYLSTTKVPLRDEDGMIVGLVGCGRDVTEQHRMQVALEEMAEENRHNAERAAVALAAKARFVATVSHEIRTPLTGLIGVVEQLAKSSLSDQQREMLATIRDCGKGLNTVLNDVLDLSRLEAGGLRLETGIVDLERTRSTLDRLYGSRVKPGTLRFDTAIAGPGSPVRTGDPHRLMQVLHNLLSNAFKFTNCGAIGLEIDVPDEQRIIVTVRDTGIGMSRDQAAVIFEPFQQAEHSTARRFGGSGLGLSIVQGLVEAMDGQISVDTEPGAGTTFTLALPLPAAVSPENGTTAATDAIPLRVLVAEDNAVNRMLLQLALESAGHAVRMVEDGLAVVELATQWHDDVVLMDISLPGRDGDEALRLIVGAATLQRRLPPPVIALTAHTDPEDVERLREAGFAAVLPKPYETEVLLSTLREIAGRQ